MGLRPRAFFNIAWGIAGIAPGTGTARSFFGQRPIFNLDAKD